MPKMPKAFTDYITAPQDTAQNTLEDYAKSPGSTFLCEAVHISDAVNHCLRHFPKKSDGDYNKDSRDSLFRLSAAALAGIMGHLETFQRFFFAGVFELTRLVPAFDVASYLKKLEKEYRIEISLGVASSYRGEPAPVGQILADSLGAWHDPERVNGYLRGLASNQVEFYSNADVEDLRTLWQLRHSVVHTAGWVTLPDAQKIPALRKYGGRQILLEPQFIASVTRRLHPMLRASVNRFEAQFRADLPGTHSKAESRLINALFRVESPRQSWF
jgi:hypothetical protein